MTAFARGVLLLAGSGCVALAIAACRVSGADVLLLVGGAIVPPTVLASFVWSAAAISGPGSLVLTLLRLRGRRVGRGDRLAMMLVGGVLATALVGTGLWCTASAVAAAGIRAIGTHADTVLASPGDRGCTLLAEETGMLRSSEGRLYSVDAVGLARPVGRWSADEIQLPIRDGGYSLKQADGIATLSFRTARFIAPKRLEFACRR